MTDNPGKSKNRLLQVLLVVILLSLIGYGFSRFVINAPRPTAVPESVAGLQLTDHSDGPQAAAAISHLHGTAIDLEDPFIAEYTRGSDHLMVWAGEAGSQSAAVDLNAQDISWKAEYLEVAEPERLAFALRNPDNHEDPNREIVTVTFEELGGKTRMVFSQSGNLPPEQYKTGLKHGWNAFFDRMDA